MSDFDHFLADVIKPGEGHGLFPGRHVRLWLMRAEGGGINLTALQAVQMAARILDCAQMSIADLQSAIEETANREGD